MTLVKSYKALLQLQAGLAVPILFETRQHWIQLPTVLARLHAILLSIIGYNKNNFGGTSRVFIIRLDCPLVEKGSREAKTSL